MPKSNVPVYWPPVQVHYGTCACGLLLLGQEPISCNNNIQKLIYDMRIWGGNDLIVSSCESLSAQLKVGCCLHSGALIIQLGGNVRHCKTT